MRRLLWAMAVVIGLGGPARADLIDQSYIPATTPTGFSLVMTSTTPIGQEFTPTLNGLDFVDLYIADNAASPGPGANIQVRVRELTITGAILATSQVEFVANDKNFGLLNFADIVPTRFTFGSQVPLSPGATYVIEFLQETPAPIGSLAFIALGDGNAQVNSTYAGGRAIVNGAPRPEYDFAFREGVFSTAIPEPSPMLLAGALGVLGAIGRLARRPR